MGAEADVCLSVKCNSDGRAERKRVLSLLGFLTEAENYGKEVGVLSRIGRACGYEVLPGS